MLLTIWTSPNVRSPPPTFALLPLIVLRSIVTSVWKKAKSAIGPRAHGDLLEEIDRRLRLGLA